MNHLDWISVKDRLPDRTDHYLVTDGEGLISTAVYWGVFDQKAIDEKRNWWNEKVGDAYWVNQHTRLIEGRMIDHDKITHWLPISALVDTLPNNPNRIKSDDGIVQVQIGGSGNIQSIK